MGHRSACRPWHVQEEEATRELMRNAIAAKSIEQLDAASAKMTEMGLGAEPLAKEGLELKDFLVKQVRARIDLLMD